MSLDDWDHYQTITIQASQVDGDLTDYPVYVDLSDLGSAFFSSVRSDGGDIRVTKSDGTTEVAREVVSIDTVAETGELYFLADGTLSSSTNTEFRIYYGKSDATEPGVTSTYGRNNTWVDYELVAHMEEDPSGSAPQITDSTGNGNDGTSEGSMTTGDQVSGQLGNAIAHDGTDDKINFGNIDITNNVTMQCWAKTTQSSGPPYFFSKDNFGGGGTRAWYMQFDLANDDVLFIVFSNTSGNKNYKHNNFNMNDGNWHSYAMTLATNDFKPYIEGTEVTGGNLTINTEATVNALPSSTTNVVTGGGANINATGSVDAQMDEVRISSVARSSDWLSTEYSNQSNPSSFYTIGSQQSPGEAAFVPRILVFM